MLVKSFKVAFSSLEMAQRSILSMLQKTNHDKNRTGNPVQSDGGLTKSVEQNRTGAGAKHYYFKSLMSLHTTKPTIKLVRPAVTQIHLRTCAPILNDSFYIS